MTELSRVEQLAEFCREHTLENLDSLREQLDSLDWSGHWPQVDQDGDLTGELVDGTGNDEYETVYVTDEGAVIGDGNGVDAAVSPRVAEQLRRREGSD